jgi:hypothetical protein
MRLHLGMVWSRECGGEVTGILDSVEEGSLGVLPGGVVFVKALLLCCVVMLSLEELDLESSGWADLGGSPVKIWGSLTHGFQTLSLLSHHLNHTYFISSTTHQAAQTGQLYSCCCDLDLSFMSVYT